MGYSLIPHETRQALGYPQAVSMSQTQITPATVWWKLQSKANILHQQRETGNASEEEMNLLHFVKTKQENVSLRNMQRNQFDFRTRKNLPVLIKISEMINLKVLSKESVAFLFINLVMRIYLIINTSKAAETKLSLLTNIWITKWGQKRETTFQCAESNCFCAWLWQIGGINNDKYCRKNGSVLSLHSKGKTWEFLVIWQWKAQAFQKNTWLSC